jgi:hypothetical protein
MRQVSGSTAHVPQFCVIGIYNQFDLTKGKMLSSGKENFLTSALFTTATKIDFDGRMMLWRP